MSDIYENLSLVFSLVFSFISFVMSMFALYISIWRGRNLTKSNYYQRFITRLDALSAEVCSYSIQESEQKCQIYLTLISQQQNNHICNQDKQQQVSTCCTKIRLLLPKLSKQDIKDKNSILENISQLISDIETSIQDFCYK